MKESHILSLVGTLRLNVWTFPRARTYCCLDEHRDAHQVSTSPRQTGGAVCSALFSSNAPALRRPPPGLPAELLNCQEEEKLKASRVYFDEHSSPPSPQLEPHAERLQREEGRRRDLITRCSGALKVVGSSAKTLISSALHPRSYGNRYLSCYSLNAIIY